MVFITIRGPQAHIDRPGGPPRNIPQHFPTELRSGHYLQKCHCRGLPGTGFHRYWWAAGHRPIPAEPA